MERCETCVHWMFEGPDWEYEALKVGECKRVLMREEVERTAIEAAGHDRWNEPGRAAAMAGLKAARAYVVYGSSYYAALRTFPDFGCVLHTPKTQTDV